MSHKKNYHKINSNYPNFEDNNSITKNLDGLKFNSSQKDQILKKENYDIVIDINSIRYLQTKGWEILYPNGRKEELNKIIESSEKCIVSILGHSNRGKTFILQRISGLNLESGYQIQTKGLSIKLAEKTNILLLDTAGTNVPLLIEEGAPDPRNDKNFLQNELYYINLCQIITNYILQTFIIKIAEVLICVVGMLTASEQVFLNKVKKNCRNKKKLIVIHNLTKCYKKEEIEIYKQKILLNNIIDKYEEKPIPSFDEKINFYNNYYIEKDEDGTGHQYNVLHFIFGNDFSEEIKPYNDSTIKFIKDYIDTKINKSLNLFEKLIEHVTDISSSVLTKELTSITLNNDNIKCSEEIRPKEIIADELDNIIFIGKDYEPSYGYYKKNGQFIISINICSKLKENSLKVKHKVDKDVKEYTIFKISGERLIQGEKNNDNVKIFKPFINKRENLKKFKLNFKVKLKEDFDITLLDSQYKKNIKYGILFLSFNIIN